MFSFENKKIFQIRDNGKNKKTSQFIVPRCVLFTWPEADTHYSLLLRIYFLTVKSSLNFSISYRGNSGSFKQEPESKNNFINNYGDETGRYNHLLRFRKYNDSKLAYHQQQGRKYTPAS